MENNNDNFATSKNINKTFTGEQLENGVEVMSQQQVIDNNKRLISHNPNRSVGD